MILKTIISRTMTCWVQSSGEMGNNNATKQNFRPTEVNVWRSNEVLRLQDHNNWTQGLRKIDYWYCRSEQFEVAGLLPRTGNWEKHMAPAKSYLHLVAETKKRSSNMVQKSRLSKGILKKKTEQTNSDENNKLVIIYHNTLYNSNSHCIY